MKLSPQSVEKSVYVSRGYGYVQYENEKSADEAVKRMNGEECGNKKVKLVFWYSNKVN